MNDLSQRRCAPCHGGAERLHPDVIEGLSRQIPAWTVRADELERTFRFPHYGQTMAFVNAVAWIAHSEDHHPDLSVHYDRVVVRWSTHSVGGLTENDFVCAAKVDALLPG